MATWETCELVKEKEGDPDEKKELFRPSFTSIRASDHEGYGLDFRGIENAAKLIHKRLLQASDRSFMLPSNAFSSVWLCASIIDLPMKKMPTVGRASRRGLRDPLTITDEQGSLMTPHGELLQEMTDVSVFVNVTQRFDQVKVYHPAPTARSLWL